MRKTGWASVTVALVAGALWLGACTGGSGESASGGGADAAADESASFPSELVQASWVVRYADAENLGALTEPGWVALINHRHIQKAVEQSGDDKLLAGRAHLEAALLYEQAAMLAAHSFIEVYGKTPEPTDPAGAKHLLAVSYAVLGDTDKARAASKELPAGDPTAGFHAPWKAWLEGDATWPPDLSSLPLQLPEVAPGVFPTLPPPPHYELPEQGGSSSKRTMADPGALVAVSLWHRAAARAALGDGYDAIRALRAGYALPVEGLPGKPGPREPMELFGSTLITPGDADFMVDLLGAAGAGAVEAHAGTSMLAHLAKEARVDGKVDPDKVSRLIGDMRNAFLDASREASNGEAGAHHRIFADISAAGAYWSLALVAEVEGDRERGGLLRLLARDKAELGNHVQDAVSLLSLAAWDAGNRNVHRAPELLHDQARRYPGLEVARYGLDVLALRVQHERIEPSGM